MAITKERVGALCTAAREVERCFTDVRTHFRGLQKQIARRELTLEEAWMHMEAIFDITRPDHVIMQPLIEEETKFKLNFARNERMKKRMATQRLDRQILSNLGQPPTIRHRVPKGNKLGNVIEQPAVAPATGKEEQFQNSTPEEGIEL